MSNSKNNKIAVLVLIILNIFSGFTQRYTLNLVQWAWDDGTCIYPAFAWAHGKIPNLDFVNGYPGLMTWLLKTLFEVFNGNQLQWAHLLGLFFTVIICTCLFLITYHLLNITAAVIVYLNTFCLSYSPGSMLNSGLGMSACISLGVLLIYLFVTKNTGDPDRPSAKIHLFYLGTFFISLSMSFKQAGLFGVLGLLQLILILLPRGQKRNYIKWLFFAIFVLLPFIAFLVIRLKDTITMVPQNAIVILPWFLAIVINFRLLISPINNIPIRLKYANVLIALLIILLGAFFWLILYPFSLENIRFLLVEIFIRIPKLIDRDIVAMSFSRAFIWFTFVFCYLVFPILYRKLNKNKEAQNYYIYFIFLLLFILASIIGYKNSAELLINAIAPLHWNTYLLPATIGAISSILILGKPINFLKLNEIMFVLIGYTFFASGYPYPRNAIFATLGLVSCYLVFIIYLRKQYDLLLIKRKFSLILTFSIIASIFSILFFTYSQNNIPCYTYSNLNNSKLRVRKGQIPFIEAASWIKNNLQPNDSLGGYPNFALTMALAGKLSFDRFPNFIGDKNDFYELIRNVSENGPTFYIVSPNLYPYEIPFPYFCDPKPLLDVLYAKYKLVANFKSSDGQDAILVFRKI